MRNFKINEIVVSPVTKTPYRIGEMLGSGGFGSAHRVHSLNGKGEAADEFCLKTTNDSQSWHRESYFGEMLKDCDRAIHMHESFPLFAQTKRHDVAYCLIFELAESGTVWDYLESTRRPWAQKRATQEVIGLLKVLDHLHGSGAIHRDITPLNVLVCKNKRLKLADFGIAKHVINERAALASVFNWRFAPKAMAHGLQNHWLASDDVYQMGQLLAMLLRADPKKLIEPDEVETLPCDEALKGVIAKAIAPRKGRYSNAHELMGALRGDIVRPHREVSNLQGRTVISGL